MASAFGSTLICDDLLLHLMLEWLDSMDFIAFDAATNSNQSMKPTWLRVICSHLDIRPLRGLLYTPFWIRWLIDRGVQTSSMQVVLCSKDRITDAVFEGICLTELLSISIVGGNCDISDASLRVIATGCVNLLNIEIVRCPRLTWQSLAAISKHCKGAKSFAMNECN